MDGEDNDQDNKIGYENEPDYSTLKGAQAEEAGELRQAKPSARDQAANLAKNSEDVAAGAKKAGEAAAKFGSGDYVGAAKDAVGAVNKFTNATKGKEEKEKGSASSTLKKAAPAIGVVLLIGVVALALSSQVAMPFHLIANIKEKLDGWFGAKSTAAESSLAAMIDGSPELGEAINENVGYDGISQEACDELYLYNIEYYKSKGIRGCTPTALKGETEEPADPSSIRSKVPEDAIFASNSSTSDPKAYAGAFVWVDKAGIEHEIGPEEFADYFNNNTEFNNAISQGSLAWTGSFSGWFDDMVDKLMEKLEVTRNDFQNYYEDINDQTKSAEAYKEIIEAINSQDKRTMSHTDNEKLVFFDSCSSTNQKGLARRSEIIEQTNANFITSELKSTIGGCTVSSPPSEISDLCTLQDSGDYLCPKSALYDTTSYTIVGEKIDDAAQKVESYLPEMSKSFKKISDNEECAQLYGISYFSIIVAANRLHQATTFAAQALEAIDKTKGGLGHESGIHQLGKQLSEKGTYQYLDDGDNISGLEASLKTSTTDRTALNSEGLSWINTNSIISSTDKSVSKLSVEGVMKGFILEAGTIASCSAATITGNILYGLVSIIIGKSHTNFDANDASMLTVERNLIDQAIRQAAYGLVYNPCTTDADGNLAKNEDVGNCIALGAHNYLSQNHRLAGGSPADQAKLQQYVERYRHTMARQKEQDRANRSPFDISSPNTFLGSIVNTITPYASTLASSSIFTSLSSLVSSSINSILPATSAIMEDTLAGNIGSCKLLGGLNPEDESAGAVGDAFCVPYIITDVSLFDPELEAISAKEVEKKVESLDGLKSGKTKNNNREINPESNFARYIKYCSNRVSIFGVIDANILKDYLDEHRPGFFESIINTIGGLFGFYDKLTIEDERVQSALAWATGRNCVATDNSAINNNFWNNEGRYYQAYMVYQRVNINRAGGDGNNALETIQSWDDEHPITSPEDFESAQLGMLTEDYIPIKNYLVYQILNKSTFGPTVAVSDNPSSNITFRRSITPLTDLIIDNVFPLNGPYDLLDPKKQATTA